MKIYTLTLSPAYDVHAFTQEFAACHENLATVSSREAGGKGVNISRALKNYGVENTAVVVLGKENAQEFRQSLQQSGLECVYFEKEGRIRENLTLHCANAPETRISFTGFPVDGQVLDQIRQLLEVDEETIVTFTGRVPDGISMDAAIAFLQELKQKGAKIVLDSRSFGFAHICQVQPWLIKPNQEEISMFFGCAVETVEQATRLAMQFADRGVENVMVSLGGQGALLITQGKIYRAQPPKIQAISTIGAGDSSIAGFLAATLQGKQPAQQLQMAVAFGTAACMQEGSLPPAKEDIDRVYAQVNISN